MHSLLRRQLTRLLGTESVPAGWEPLLAAVDTSYCQFDSDRAMLERSLDLSSQELLQANADLRGMLRAFPDVFFRLAPDGTILDLRGSRTKGCLGPVEPSIGRRIQDVPGGELGRRFAEALSEVRERGSILSLEYSLPTGASEIHFEARLVPLQQAEVIVLLRDITERRSLELQLVQAQKMDAVGRLAGGIAHDFNNLLTTIIGYSELVLEGLADPRLRGHVEEIMRSGERAAALTRQLLAFSRKQVLQPRVLNLNEVVDGLRKMLERLIGENIRVVTRLDPALRRVRADFGQFEQVIVNLAVNARDAMPEGGELLLESANVEFEDVVEPDRQRMSPGSYVLLSVSDTGCGMEPETQSRIFEPFFTTKEMGKGTGLGLSTVYGIVKQSGGYIWTSSRLGEGSTFRIYLPAVDAPAEAAVSRAEMRRGRDSGTVLVLEDEGALRALTREILVHNGYQVLDAATGTECLRLSATFGGRIDLLLSDVVLPDFTGPAVAERLLRERPGVKVLFMSGYTDPALPREILRGNASAYLQKPFTGSGLLAALDDLLRRT